MIMLEFEFFKNYQILPVSSNEQFSNQKSFQALLDSDQNNHKILIKQDEKTAFAYLNQKRNAENPNDFLPIESQKPHLFFFSQEYGTLEFELINQTENIFTPPELKTIFDNLMIGDSNYPENHRLNLRLLSRKRETNDPKLNVHILSHAKPILPPEPAPYQPSKKSEPTPPCQPDFSETKLEHKYFTPEELKQKTKYYSQQVIASYKTNYSPKNYIVDETPNFDQLSKPIFNSKSPENLGNLIKLTGEGVNGLHQSNTTNILFIPGPNETIIFISPFGLKVDNFSRNGNFDFSLIIKNEITEQFKKDLQENPQLIYSLIEKVNEHPITDFWNNPVNIQPGEKVRILANQPIGGSIEKNIDTVPFPSDFKPNQATEIESTKETMDIKERANFFASKISEFAIPLTYENGRGSSTGGNVESSKNFNLIWPYELNHIISEDKTFNPDKDRTYIFIIPNQNTPNSTCFYIDYSIDNPYYEGELMRKSAQIIMDNEFSQKFQEMIKNNPNLLFETLKEKIQKPLINYSIKNKTLEIKINNPVEIYNYSNQS
jgi:hypothetical protein